MKTKRKNIFKSLLALTLALIMVLGVAPLSELAGVDWAGLFTPKAEAEGKTYKVGDIVEFGSYPQSKVTDSSLVSALNGVSKTWVSYGYYSGDGSYSDTMVQGDWMKYADFTYNGTKYRAVTFSQYRPYYTSYSSSSSYTYQDDNGYTTNNIYYFKYEPLKWRVLDPSTGLVLCESIIDSQAYSNTIYKYGTDPYGYTAYWNDAEHTHYANDYATSSIRAWLNDDFYNTAFSSSQKASILTSELDNKAYSTSYSEYDSETTYDKIFLLSYSEMQNTACGFSSSSARQAKGTDYAKCQGLWVNSSNECSYQRLRSAGNYSYYTCYVYSGGGLNSYWYVNNTNYGVRPALKISNLASGIFESGGSESGETSNLKTYYGTFEDTVIATVINGNASWIGGAIIDGKTYNLSRDSKYQSTIDNCKGKKVVFTVKDDEIIWIKPAEDIKTSISCSVNPDSVMYSGKKYSSDTANVIVKISNTLCESDFVGNPEVLANIPELELIIPNAELKIDSNNIFSFNGKQIYSTPVKTLGLGESETFCVTANVKNKKPENAAESKVGINCTFNVTQGNRSFSKVAYGAFKIINNGYKEPTQENVNNSGDKEYRDKLAKAAQELEKATTAFTLEADLSNSLGQIFTKNQLNFIARMILCEAAMKGAPEETFREELERKVIEKVFSINTRWLRLFNDKIVVTVAVQTEKYGMVQVEFTYNRQLASLNGNPYAFYGDVTYKIIKSDKTLPSSVNRSGPTGAIYMADMSAFCKAAYSVAESELKRSYNKAWGDDANKAADLIFGKSVNKILSKTKYGSVSGLVWAAMTAPAKKVEIKCPVDIYVYDKDNKLVAAVEDNKVTLSDPNVDISVDGDTKTVMLYDETYRIEYKSAAESTMDIVISEFAGYDQLLETTTFEKVPLKIGVNYTQNIDNTYMNDSEYSLTSNEEDKILPTETKLELHAHTSSSEWKVGREATCAEYGWNYNYCDECNEWYDVITTADHTFGSWQTVTAPTVDSEGLEKRVCSKCGAEETHAISKLEPVQVTSIKLNKSKKSLNIGDTFTLTATIKPNDATNKSVTWSSSDTSVATVDENGVVTAVSEGTATITATASNGVEASCTVTVKQKSDGILKKILNLLLSIILAPFRLIIGLIKLLLGK